MGTRLELTWPGKDKFLLTPRDADGKPQWVERTHPAAHEVRLADFTGQFGEVNDADPYADNLLITGDSLDALRVLARVPEYARQYRGRVKLAYWDVPFNTGQTFEHYDDWLDHSTWLSFMRDRLLLMKELLAPDGSVWVHLDDAEVHRMRVLMDEVFGADNFVTTVIWQKIHARNNSAMHFSADHDFILVYAKNAREWRPNRVARTAKSDGDFWNPDDDPRGLWRRSDLTASKPYADGHYEVVGPHGDVFKPRPGRPWAVSRATFEELREDDRLWWGKTGRTFPFRKRFAAELGDLVPNTVWLNEDVGNNREAKAEIAKVFGRQDAFSTPKPERLLERVIHIGSNPGDIVLDAFAGSGTTAAVAHKMGRRWVSSEVSESTVESFTQPRLEKVVSADDQGGVSGSVGWDGGGGFRSVSIAPTAYAETPFGVMLDDWATEDDKFARLMAGQLGFFYEPDGPFCGRRGRMRLVAIAGQVGIEEAAVALSALDASERVTIVATVLLDGVEEFVREQSRGSRVMKAPRDVLRPRRIRKGAES